MPKQKREETGSLSKSERQKLQRLYTHGNAAYGSVRNLAKASKLPVSKVRQFFHSKDSYTKFTLATRKFKRMRAFARYKNEIWCMDLAYVDKLANDNRGIKYLLVRQDVFDKTIDVRGLKTKDSKEALRAFTQMITKRKRPQKIWVDKGKEFAGEFKKFCDREGIQIYSTMSETKATFAERAIRSLKNVLYRYSEDYGYKYIHKLPQFVTTLNTRRNRSSRAMLKTLTLCLCYTVNQPETLTNQSSTLHTAFEFPSKIYRSEKDTSLNLQTKFLILLHLLHANIPHIIYKMNKAKLSKASFMKRS